MVRRAPSPFPALPRLCLLATLPPFPTSPSPRRVLAVSWPLPPTQAAGAPRCRCVLVPDKTHTAFLLEDPMRGGRDLLMDTVLEAVTGGSAGGGTGGGGGGGGGDGEEERLEGGDLEQGPPEVEQGVHIVAVEEGETAAAGGRLYGALCPGWLCDLAGRVCPF